jgi:hypothetical protein
MKIVRLTESTISPVLPFGGDLSFTGGGDSMTLTDNSKTSAFTGACLKIGNMIFVGYLYFLIQMILFRKARRPGFLWVNLSRVGHGEC